MMFRPSKVALPFVLAGALGIACLSLPVVATAEDSPTWQVEAEGMTAQATTSYDIGKGSVTCDQAGTLYKITGTSSKHTITVRGGTASNPVMVDLAGVTMKFQGAKDGDSTEAAPVTIEDNAYAIVYVGKDDATVVDTLTGGNEHGVGKNTGYAGICVKSNAHATIAGQGTLDVSGGGVEYGAAAIGGNYNDDVRDLTIDGTLTINATGGYSAPGIGSGRDGELYSLVIKGGTINATGGKYAPGIGAGDAVGTGGGGTTHNITITGGTITATGGYKAAGIGGSEGGSTAGIRIDGGTVTATGGEEGAGIGGGSGGDVTAIYITGGTIKATGGSNGAGIGGGKGAKSGEITVAQGSSATLDVTATGGENGAGIGSVSHDSDKIDITLAGGTITATGGHKGAGIGAGDADAGDISIKGTGTVKARSAEQACGIGAGDDSTASSIDIEGAGSGRTLTINAEALTVKPTDPETAAKPEWWWANQAAAIGSARTECGPITIANATVNAAANGYGADIGGGNIHGWGSSSVQSITITNCAVTSQDFDGNVPKDKVTASIGAGTCGKVGTIAIYKSNVVGAGIGSSSSFYDDKDANSVDSITIEDSEVKAVRQDVGWEDDYSGCRCQSAGIGSGISGNIGSITITDSNVTATGIGGGAGIGTGGVSGKLRESYEKVYESRIDTITIKGSTIDATGSEQQATSDLVTGGAGIGVGFGVSGDGSDTKGTTLHAITIENCPSVTATGKNGAAGIGISYGAAFADGDDGDGNVTITASSVTATGGYAAAGIGGGERITLQGGDADLVKITGASAVTATGGEGAAGIGGGKDGGVNSVVIALADTADANQFVNATGGKGAAGIGSGSGGLDVNSVSIQAGRVSATGGADLDSKGAGAGIGGGNGKGALKSLSISGGIVNAAGGNDAFGIGFGGTGGARTTDQDGTFTISGGTVLAASVGNAKTMIVTGGSVLANLTNAYDAAHNPVYRTTLTLASEANTKVDVGSFVDGYGTTDIYSDGSRKVYLYRTTTDKNKASADVTVGGDAASRHYIGQTLADGSGVLKMQRTVSFKSLETAPIVGGTFAVSLDDGDFSGWEWSFSTSGCATALANPEPVLSSPGARISMKANSVGTYTVSATSSSASDNEVYWPVTASYTGTVTQQAGDISITEDPSKIYDGQVVANPSVTTTGDGAVTYTYYTGTDVSAAGTKLDAAPVDQGTYTVVASMAGTDHYTAASASKSFTITPRPITLGLSASLSGDTATLTTTVANMVDAVGKVHFVITPQGSTTPTTLDVDIAKSGDSFIAQTTFANVGAGTYTVEASYIAGSSSNYSCDSTATVTFDKAKATRAITCDDSFSKTYGDAGFDIGATASESRSGDPDVFSYDVVNDSFTSYGLAASISVDQTTGHVTVSHAGKATVKITLTDQDGNYNEAVKYVTVTVARASLKVTPYAQDSSGTKKSEATYGSLDGITYGLSFDGFKGQDNASNFTNGHGTLEAVPLATTASSGTYTIGIKRIGNGSVTINGTTYYDVFVSRDYEITEGTSDFTVNPATLTVTANDATGTWGGTEPTYGVSLSGFVLGDSVSSVFSAQPAATLDTTKTDGKTFSKLEPGTYASAIKADSGTQNKNANGGENYTVATVPGTLTVAKVDSALAISVDSKTYDGKAVTAKVTTSTNPTFDGTYTVTYYPLDSETALSGAPTDAGQYRAVATVKDAAHFANDTAGCTFTISKATPDVTSPTLTDLTYQDGMTLAANQPLPAGSGWTWDNPDAVLSAGTVKANATYTPSDTTNYTTVTCELTFTVSQAAGSISITGDPSKTYDGTAVSDPAVEKSGTGTVTFAYYAGSDTTAAPLASAPKDAGGYTVVATVADDGNYKTATASKPFTISKATPDVESPTLSSIIYQDGLILADESLPANWSWNEPKRSLSVGHVDASATYTPADTANYDTVTRTLSFEVLEGQGTVSITEDVSKTYDGSSVETPAVSTTGDGAVTFSYYAGADITAKPLASAPVDAGTYTVVATLAETKSYKGASDSKSFEIRKAPIVLSISATQSATSATVTVTALGMVSADGSAKISVPDASGTAVEKVVSFAQAASGAFEATATFDSVASGTYTVTSSYVTGASGNYTCEKDATATFDKTKATRTIDVASPIAKTYGDSAFALGATASSSLTSDTFTYEVVQDSFEAYGFDPCVLVDDSGNVTVKNAGSCYVKITLTDSTGTYNDAVAYVKVTVARAALKVTSFAVSGNTHVTEAAYGSLGSLDYGIGYEGLENGDTPEGFTNGHGTLEARDLDERSIVATDPYAIPIDQVGTGSSSSGLASTASESGLFLSRNYAITYQLGTLTVTPAQLVVSAADASGEWHGTEPGYDTSVVGLASWDSTDSVFTTKPTASLDTTKTGGKTYDQLEPGTYANAISVASTGTLRKNANGLENYTVTAAAGSGAEAGTLTVTPATPDVETPTLPDLTMRDGLILADQTLPAGWSWVNPTRALSVGHVEAEATYTPSDTTHYSSVTRTLAFEVVEKPAASDDSASSDTAAKTPLSHVASGVSASPATASATPTTGDGNPAALALAVASLIGAALVVVGVRRRATRR